MPPLNHEDDYDYDDYEDYGDPDEFLEYDDEYNDCDEDDYNPEDYDEAFDQEPSYMSDGDDWDGLDGWPDIPQGDSEETRAGSSSV